MSEVIYETESLCPICLRKIPARYEECGGQVYLTKTCSEHGNFRVLFWRDADMYRRWSEQAVHAPARDSGPEEKRGCPLDCGICAGHRSGVCTAILEITYRCNMKCNICFADASMDNREPGLEDIRRMYGTALEANKYCSVQLSGGEPTVREDLPEIVRMGKDMDVVHLQINTNGLRIAQDMDYLLRLRDAGADLIYLQFDGTDDDIYRTIRGREMMDVKQRAIENCEKAGIGVLLVPVVIPGVNLHRLGEIVAFAKEHIPTVKGIHFQPVSYFGRYPGLIPPDESRCGLDDVLHALEEQTGGELRMEHFAPRKQFDAHCDFSGTYYLDESGVLKAVSRSTQCCGDTEDTDFVAKTNSYTNKRWRLQNARSGPEFSELKKFALRTLTHSFSVSGMGFQDAWNIDTGRLRGCCVFIVDRKCRLIPFCAFHLTGADGRRLYSD